MNRSMKLTVAFAICALAVVLPAHAAPPPGINLPDGQAYSIDGCPQIRGGCSTTTIGADDQGSLSIRMAAGETMMTYIGGVPVMYHEGGYTSDEAITYAYGRLMTGAIYTTPARTVVDDYTVENTDSTVLVNTSTAGHDVYIALPSAVYHPGRRVTIKKVGGKYNVILVPSANGVVDGAVSTTLGAQWSFVTVEGTPDGNPYSGWTSNSWSIVGH